MMLVISPKQLKIFLRKKLHTVYLLLGNDPFLLQDSYELIYKTAIIYGFNESYTFQLDDNTDWQKIFYLCKSTSLFSTRQIMQLLLPENGPNNFIDRQLDALLSLLHSDLLLIIRGNKLNKSQEQATWFTSISSCSIQVVCLTPEQIDLQHWIIEWAKSNNLQLDSAACKLLCYYYEGNLLALTQTLKQLIMLWPSGSKLTTLHIKAIAIDVAHFKVSHWIDSLLTSNSNRALRILHQLHLEDIDPLILLRKLQRELLLLVTIKRQLVSTSLYFVFEQYNVHQSRRFIISQALTKLSADQLYHVIQLLTRIELILKQEYNHQLVWRELENLSILLCNNHLINLLIYDSV